MIKRADTNRADYIKRFYGIGSEQPTHYDVVINTDRITPEQAAALIVQAARGAGEPGDELRSGATANEA